MNNNQGFFFVSVFSLQSNKAKLQMDYKKKKAYMKDIYESFIPTWLPGMRNYGKKDNSISRYALQSN